jgi:phenylalanyl-tRNA synthetase beta chain
VPPRSVVVPDADDAATRALARCRQLLLGLGFTEAVHYSFLAAAELDAFDPRAPATRLALPNPVSADYAVLRDSLLPQLAATLGRNHTRQVESAALFEIGRVFQRDAAQKPVEETRVALGFYGPVGRGALDRRRAISNEEAALWMKGALEALACRLNAGELALRAIAHPAMEPGWACAVTLNGAVVGVLGALNGVMRHAWRMTCPMVVAELALTPLLANVGRAARVANPPSYPAVRRDLALLAPRALAHGAIAAAMRGAAPPELTEIALFDIFESKEIGRDKRSLAYTLEFRSPSRTLTDDEVNAALRKIIAALKETLAVEIREG